MITNLSVIDVIRKGKRMNKEKRYYEAMYWNWMCRNQEHARELEKENAELVFKQAPSKPEE